MLPDSIHCVCVSNDVFAPANEKDATALVVIKLVVSNIAYIAILLSVFTDVWWSNRKRDSKKSV